CGGAYYAYFFCARPRPRPPLSPYTTLFRSRLRPLGRLGRSRRLRSARAGLLGLDRALARRLVRLALGRRFGDRTGALDHLPDQLQRVAGLRFGRRQPGELDQIAVLQERDHGLGIERLDPHLPAGEQILDLLGRPIERLEVEA